MKNKIIIFILCLFLLPISVNAKNKIYKIDMDINVLQDGSANITETWDVDGDDGTEWYKVLTNLGESEVSNFTVSMDGNPLIYKTWDINENLYQKKGYYGINKTSNGLELCFGKYDYSRHTFTLNYTISNFVFNTDDSQVIYFNFIDRLSNVDFDDFSVTLTSYYSFPDTLDVWGYGYKGYAYVNNGKIEMSNEENSDMDGNYVVLLANFPLNTFTTTNSYSQFNTFNDVYNKAEDVNNKYTYNNLNKEENVVEQQIVIEKKDEEIKQGKILSIISKIFISIFSILLSILNFILDIILAIIDLIEKFTEMISAYLFIGFCIGVVVLFIISINSRTGFGYKNNKKINKKEISMFREIPCNKDIYYANILICLNERDYNIPNLFSAIILKMIKEKKISLKNEKVGIFNKETTIIDLTMKPIFDNEFEKLLFNLLVRASKDRYLTAGEFELWCKNNINLIVGYFENLINNELRKLHESGNITKREGNEAYYNYVMDDKMYEDSVKLYGLKKFLNEFSNMKDKEINDMVMWEEYLVFACLFGVADKVGKQLKNIYPNEINQIKMLEYDYETISYLNGLSNYSLRIKKENIENK